MARVTKNRRVVGVCWIFLAVLLLALISFDWIFDRFLWVSFRLVEGEGEKIVVINLARNRHSEFWREKRQFLRTNSSYPQSIRNSVGE